MNPAQWRRLKSVFEAVLDQPAHDRPAVIARALADDPELRREAELLLAAHDTAGDFLEQPASISADDLGGDDGELDADGIAEHGVDHDAGHEVDRDGDGGDEHDAPIASGTQIGPYTVLGVLGRGGMGIVYVAEDRRLGRRVALKALPSPRAGDTTMRARLRREARAAATIVHPNIATIYALEEIEAQLFIASELIGGETLRREIARGPLAPRRARDLGIEIARALRAAHDAGVVHRDLKPENVLITTDGHAKIVDFGIANVGTNGVTKLTRDGAILGTPAYMAPEQLLGGDADPRSDIYAFGLVLGEMRTGRHPMSPPPAGPRGQPGVPPLSEPGSDVHGDDVAVSFLLGAVAERCVHIDPGARYQTAQAMLRDLEREPADFAKATGRSTDGRASGTTLWWWQFHQVVTAAVYWLTIAAAWQGRSLLGGAAGRTFFLVVLGAVSVAANLRLHLWFTSRFYPAELTWAQRRVSRWIQAADWVFVVSLAAAGLLINDDGSPLPMVLLGLGIASALAFTVIEPATARAAGLGATERRPT